jgi:hypothetical protein
LLIASRRGVDAESISSARFEADDTHLGFEGPRGAYTPCAEEDGEREMKPPSPELQSTARRLIEDAATGRDDAAAITRAAEQVFQRLHDHLAKLIGVLGFRTMLARSLKLAQARLPALKGIEVDSGGAIVGLSEALAARSPAEALEGSATLLSHFLDLLAAFVGDDFASHLVREAAQRQDERGLPRAPEDEVSADEDGSLDDR